MNEFLRKLFSSDFMPHGYCYLWKPEIVWLHAASDGAIALSYLFIPLALVYFVRRVTRLLLLNPPKRFSHQARLVTRIVSSSM